MPDRIIVAGIYRSGTSLITDLVRRWGAYAGRQKDIFEDQYGYMEHFALQKLNDDLLNNNSRVPTPIDQMLEKAEDPQYKERAMQILETMDNEANENQAVAWVWKDPRLPLVLPFWSKIWGNVIYIVPVRHPVETVLSAAKMEGLETDQVPLSGGFAYWQFCMLNLLALTHESHRKIFIAYDKLIQHPEQECERLSHFLDAQCNLPSENARARINEMSVKITASQHHFQSPRAFAEVETATREQRALFNFLRIKTMYPDEPYNKDDFSIYPGWMEYLQTIDLLMSGYQQQNPPEN